MPINKKFKDIASLADEIIDAGIGQDLLNTLADKLQTEPVERTNYLLFLGLDQELSEDLKDELASVVNGYTDSSYFPSCYRIL